MKVTLWWIVSLLLVQSCSNGNGKKDVKLRDTSGGSDIYKLSKSSISTLSACDLLASFPSDIDSIIAYPRSIVGMQDSCTLALLDSLLNRFIMTRNIQYMVALDSVAEVSDGYVSEYFEAINVALYRHALPGYLNYLEKLDSNRRMIRFLMFGLQNEVQNYTDSIKRFNDLVSLAKKVAMTPAESEFINRILMDVKRKLDQGEE